MSGMREAGHLNTDRLIVMGLTLGAFLDLRSFFVRLE